MSAFNFPITSFVIIVTYLNNYFEYFPFFYFSFQLGEESGVIQNVMLTGNNTWDHVQCIVYIKIYLILHIFHERAFS